MIKNYLFMAVALMLSACQSAQKLPATTQPIATPATDTTAIITHPVFSINGKIGITTQTQEGKKAISAFYAWGQDNDRFAIELTGAAGVGATSIRYDGQTATLINGDIGEVSADSPEELLLKATGWHAPISHFPYWIMGKNSDGDSDSQFDNGRLIQTTNAHWSVTLSYKANDARPNRLRITHTDGHRVVLTINHQ